MNQREAKAVAKFIESSMGRLKIFKIENKIPGPIPDLICENRKGTSFWIEAKQIIKWPSRSTTCPLKGAFERGQQGWSRAWISWGGNAFCLLRVGEGRSYEFFLLDFTGEDLERVTLDDFERVVIKKGISNIIEYLENI